MSKLFTTTISLPRTLAKRVRHLSQAESRTMSELFREAFRFYEESRVNLSRQKRSSGASWTNLRKSLKRISTAGAKRNLAAFIARDRQAH